MKKSYVLALIGLMASLVPPAFADGWPGTATVVSVAAAPPTTKARRGTTVSTTVTANYKGEIVGGTPGREIIYGFYHRLKNRFSAPGDPVKEETLAGPATLDGDGRWNVTPSLTLTYAYSTGNPWPASSATFTFDAFCRLEAEYTDIPEPTGAAPTNTKSCTWIVTQIYP